MGRVEQDVRPEEVAILQACLAVSLAVCLGGCAVFVRGEHEYEEAPLYLRLAPGQDPLRPVVELSDTREFAPQRAAQPFSGIALFRYNEPARRWDLLGTWQQMTNPVRLTEWRYRDPLPGDASKAMEQAFPPLEAGVRYMITGVPPDPDRPVVTFRISSPTGPLEQYPSCGRIYMGVVSASPAPH